MRTSESAGRVRAPVQPIGVMREGSRPCPRARRAIGSRCGPAQGSCCLCTLALWRGAKKAIMSDSTTARYWSSTKPPGSRAHVGSRPAVLSAMLLSGPPAPQSSRKTAIASAAGATPGSPLPVSAASRRELPDQSCLKVAMSCTSAMRPKNSGSTQHAPAISSTTAPKSDSVNTAPLPTPCGACGAEDAVATVATVEISIASPWRSAYTGRASLGWPRRRQAHQSPPFA